MGINFCKYRVDCECDCKSSVCVVSDSCICFVNCIKVVDSIEYVW